eukprot:2132289-Rhodomonas_salina.5
MASENSRESAKRSAITTHSSSTLSPYRTHPPTCAGSACKAPAAVKAAPSPASSLASNPRVSRPGGTALSCGLSCCQMCVHGTLWSCASMNCCISIARAPSTSRSCTERVTEEREGG